MKLLEALETVTAEDLAKLDQKIGELERMLATYREARKLVDVRLNGEPATKKPGRKKRAAVDPPGETATAPIQSAALAEPVERPAAAAPDEEEDDDLVMQIYDWIQKNGPAKPGVIANHLQGSPAIVGMRTSGHAWFDRDNQNRVTIKTL